MLNGRRTVLVGPEQHLIIENSGPVHVIGSAESISITAEGAVQVGYASVNTPRGKTPTYRIRFLNITTQQPDTRITIKDTRINELSITGSAPRIQIDTPVDHMTIDVTATNKARIAPEPSSTN